MLQWNFWFTDKLSAFGEPGVNLYFLGNHGFGAGPALYIGGRVRVADRITITGAPRLPDGGGRHVVHVLTGARAHEPVGATICRPFTGARVGEPVPGVAVSVNDALVRLRKTT